VNSCLWARLRKKGSSEGGAEQSAEQKTHFRGLGGGRRPSLSLTRATTPSSDPKHEESLVHHEKQKGDHAAAKTSPHLSPAVNRAEKLQA